VIETPTLQAVRSFLRTVAEGVPPTDEQLARALDELVVGYHQAPEGSPADDETDPPDSGRPARYAYYAERFPQLGLYSVADPLNVPDEKPLVSDAIDDLADIASDLEEVIWRSENLGADDAHWHFRRLYTIHWGQHVRELSLYLHTKLW